MPADLLVAAANMSVAVACGALIGMERQIRQRKAGLRTNALVALGAAAYMVFSTLIEGDMSPSRVAAQVVSGIGFLGAGIIFRDGANVHGLTTAATLWCAAAVGLLAGSGHWDYALVTTGLVVFVNFALRPFVQWMKRKMGATAPGSRQFTVTVLTPAAQEAQTRSLILGALARSGLQLTGIELRPSGEAVELVATVGGDGPIEARLEQVVQRIAAEPGLLRCTVSDEG